MKLALALGLLAISGCMQPDPTGTTDPTTSKSGVEDRDLLAGATSSTNWPQEDAPALPTWVSGSTESEPVLRFLDSSGAPLHASGRMTLYRAGIIPAFTAPESTVVAFENSGTQIVSHALLLQIDHDNADSVFFSVRVDLDSVESFMCGFLYSTRLKKILASPFSGKPDYSFNFASRRFAIHGVADPSLLKLGFPVQGKTTLCFYIPGSPFFFNVIPDSVLTIGPVPVGDFPVRLMRITASAGQTGPDQLEVYEVKVASFNLDSSHPKPYKVISCGKKIFTSMLKASDSVRVD
jgi:hypothetical protein